MHDSIYEPAEDSYLLQKQVSALASGSVLDIGTGSGIQALTALQSTNVTEVTAIDLNKDAINHGKSQSKTIQWIHSDIFTWNTNKTFDTIVCNSPYLPSDKRAPDVALDGGKHGYEFCVRLIGMIGDLLTVDGQLLLLLSSLTKPQVVIDAAKQQLFDVKTVGSQKVSFEELIVLRITKSSLRQQMERAGCQHIRYFAQGKRGIVHRCQYKNKESVIKSVRSNSGGFNTIEKETNWLTYVNNLKLGPSLFYSEEHFLVMGCIDGVSFEDYVQTKSKTAIKKVVFALFDQMKTLDKHQVQKQEMHHPTKHIIVAKHPVLLDFERMRKTQRPQNLTQFIAYLTNTRMQRLLSKKGIVFSPSTMRKLSQEYKNNSEELYKNARKQLTFS